MPEPTIVCIQSESEFPTWTSREDLVSLLYHKMQPFNDDIPEIEKGLDYAFGKNGGRGGFVLLAEVEQRLVGALVMLKTGMSGYIPENILLFVAVDPDLRGMGIGRKIIDEALKRAEGDVKLHVEHDNPAIRLYKRVGFGSKYLEMRFKQQ